MLGIKMNPFNMISQLALAAATGGTSMLAMTALKTIGSQIAMQLIQNLGQQMGLPPSMINLAQAAFASASGQPGLAKQNIGEAVRDFTQQLDLSPSQAGQLQRELMNTADKSLATLSKITDSFAKKLLKGGSGDEEEGGSILMKIARALGGLVDDKMNKLAQKAEDLGKVGAQTGNTNKDGAFTGKGSGEFGKLSAEVQALGQEIGYLSNALSTTLKSIGEAAATLARKG
jgi:hypothetical protein